MNYKSPVPLLEDTYRALSQAIQDDTKLRAVHSDNSSGFWPSAASIEYEEVNPETGLSETKVAGSCLRQTYYQYTKQPPSEPTSARAHKTWALGAAAEDIVRKWFHAVPRYRVVFPDINNKKLRFNSNSTNVRGETDLIMQDTETNIMFGAEIKTYDGPDAAIELVGYEAAKTAYRANMRYHKKDDPIRNQEPFPKIQNLLQTMLYLEQFWDSGIRLWKIIYVARDKGPDVEFDVTLATVNDNRIAVVNGKAYPKFNLKAIYKRFETLKDFADKKQLPPKDYVPEYDSLKILNGNYPQWMKDKVSGKLKGDDDPIIRDWQCRFCAYIGTCLAEPSDHSIF